MQVSPKNESGAAPALSADVLRQMAEGLESIRKDEVTVYRGTERRAILSLASPARGRLSAHSIRLVGDCCARRGLASRHPQALKAYRGKLAGYILFEPVEVHDPTQTDQYEINWYKGNRVAFVDLLEIMQPRNLEVPQGYVSEMPVSLEQLPGAGWLIVLHSGAATVRPEKEVTPEEEEQFTATDEDLLGGTSAAAGQQG